MIEIPKIVDFSEGSHDSNKPGWFQPQRDGVKLKPVIRCNCGNYCGIGLHHVHADGTVTASFFHAQGTNYAIGESAEGCGWHVHLKLLDYDGGEFLPTGPSAS